MKLKRPKIRKTAKKWYSAQFYIRKYSENAHLHGNGFKSMFLPIKILEPRFFWSLRHTSNQKTSKEKWAPPKIFLDKYMYVRDFYKFTWMWPRFYLGPFIEPLGKILQQKTLELSYPLSNNAMAKFLRKIWRPEKFNLRSDENKTSFSKLSNTYIINFKAIVIIQPYLYNQ